MIGDEGARTGLLEPVGGRGPPKAGGAGGEAVDGFLGLLRLLPVAEAAELPVGEVGFVDGLAVELRLEESPNFGEGIEPIGGRFGFFAVLQAEVDLLAKILRQPRDFAFYSI